MFRHDDVTHELESSAFSDFIEHLDKGVASTDGA
jgi:hypothetical protein